MLDQIAGLKSIKNLLVVIILFDCSYSCEKDERWITNIVVRNIN
jgi:hypothetical protein